MVRPVHILLAGLALVCGSAASGVAYFGYFRNRVDPLVHAEAMAAAGNLRAAQFDFRSLLQKHPDDASLHLRIAELSLRLNDGASAEKEARQAEQKGADHWTALLLTGRALELQNRPADLLKTLPDTGPTPAITLHLLARRAAAQLALADQAGLARTAATAAAQAPTSAETAVIAAWLAAAAKDQPGVALHTDQALQIDPNNTDALLLKQNLLANQGDLPGALSALDRALGTDPWSTPARLSRANLRLASNDNAGAQADIDAILRNQPRNVSAQYIGAVLLVRTGKFEEAARAFQRIEPFAAVTPRVLYFQAVAAQRLGQARPAEDFAARYVRRAPTDPAGLILLARTELAIQAGGPALQALLSLDETARATAPAQELLGAAYLMLGRITESAQAYERAATAAPGNAVLAGRAGLLQAQTGGAATDQALDRLATLAEGHPDTGQVLVAAALAAGEPDRAQAALDQLRSQGETETTALLAGALAEARFQTDAAEAAYRLALQRNPASSEATSGLARVLVLNGQTDAAIVLLGERIAHPMQPGAPQPGAPTPGAPTSGATPATDPRLFVSYVRLLLLEKRYDAAIDALSAARRAAPTLPLALMQADILIRSGQPARAVDLLRDVAATDNGKAAANPTLQNAIAAALFAAGSPDQANVILAKRVTDAPNDLAARRAAIAGLIQAKDMPAARSATEEALRRFPGDHGLMVVLVRLAGSADALRVAAALRADPANAPDSAALQGETLLALNRAPEAVKALEAEYRATPTPLLASTLVAALMAAKEPARAEALLAARIAADPADTTSLRTLSSLELNEHRYADARKHLEALIDQGAANAQVLNNLAWTYAALKDPRALPLARRAYKQQADADTADTLGWILLQNGQNEPALRSLTLAAADRPTRFDVQYHLAAALRANGRQAEAVRLLTTITSQPAPFEGRGEAVALLDTLKAKTP